MSLTALIGAAILLTPVGVSLWRQATVPHQNLWWAALAVIVAIGMFYRYLKFFRLYTTEVFVTYAETGPTAVSATH